MAGYQKSSFWARESAAVCHPATAGSACHISTPTSTTEAIARGRNPRAASGSSSSGAPISSSRRTTLPPSGDDSAKASAPRPA